MTEGEHQLHVPGRAELQLPARFPADMQAKLRHTVPELPDAHASGPDHGGCSGRRGGHHGRRGALSFTLWTSTLA